MSSEQAQERQQDQDREGKCDYRAPRVALTLTDFELVKKLGDGSYSEVFHVRRKINGREYALKKMDKHLILRENKQKYVAQERKILDTMDSESVAKLFFTFQDASALYMGLEICPGGELFEQIRQKKVLDIDSARFYAAETILILEHLRLHGVVHRDLKPENLLLSDSGHLKLIDFGSAKVLENDETQRAPLEGSSTPAMAAPAMAPKRGSLNGTADYVAPESLQSKDVGYPADLWALGCCIYQMLVGSPPFRDKSEYLTFERIIAGEFSVPDDIAPDAADLINSLLVMEPSARLGAQDLNDLKAHAFFSSTSWTSIRQSRAPDFIPPKEPSREELEEDWELQSMRQQMEGSLSIAGRPPQTMVYIPQHAEHQQ
mmetsp:Transcript_47395/g.120990  ORF Transcript_47395/g.120990 Transcript_47395/m.120990 type:complete len:374 (-) Transcript_47395:113-1234(-)